MDHLGKLIHDLWPRLSDHDKVRLIDGVQGILSDVLSDNPELKTKCEALKLRYVAGYA